MFSQLRNPLTEMPANIYEPTYSQSHALVIGIDGYTHAPRIEHAENDAQGFARVLQEKYRFTADNLTLLIGAEATKAEITCDLLIHVRHHTACGNDSLARGAALQRIEQVAGKQRVALAGTVGVSYGFVGLSCCEYLAGETLEHVLKEPHASWLEGTSGKRQTAITSVHDEEDVLGCNQIGVSSQLVPTNEGRQVRGVTVNWHQKTGLTPTRRSSVAVTGEEHDHAVVLSDGLILGVLHERPQDPYSRQTPHCGFLDGDGDLIFAPDASGILEAAEKVTATPVKVVASNSVDLPAQESVEETLKHLLATPSEQIRLDDFVSAHVRAALNATSLERFPVQSVSVTNETFASRVSDYEAAIANVSTMAVLLGRWCTTEQLPILEKMLGRLAEGDKGSSGSVLLLRLGWYPVLYLMYSAGIAALSANNYTALGRVLSTGVHAESHENSELRPLTAAVTEKLGEIDDAFKRLPGHERHYVPCSEHLRTRQQPLLEDLLFLGRTYDRHFDRFEMFLALTCAESTGYGYGRPGRFAWKHGSRMHASPFVELMEEATRMGVDWPPLKAGLFGGSTQRFSKVAREYKNWLDELPWR